MRTLLMLLSVPVAGGLTWWGVGSLSGSDHDSASNTFKVVRKTFRVTLQEKGELKASDSIDIKSEVGGRSTIISLVSEGSSVKKGDLLVELASDEIEERVQGEKIQVASAEAALESAKRQLDILNDQNESNIRKAQLKLDMAQLEFQKYEEGEWPQQEEDAQLRIDEAQKVYERTQSDFEYSKTLYDRKFIKKSEYDADEFDLYRAEINLKKAKRDQDILRKYTRVKDLEQKTSDVSEAKKELERVKKEAENKQSEREAARRPPT